MKFFIYISSSLWSKFLKQQTISILNFHKCLCKKILITAEAVSNVSAGAIKSSANRGDQKNFWCVFSVLADPPKAYFMLWRRAISNHRHGRYYRRRWWFFSEFDNTNDENLGFVNEMMNYEILTKDDNN